MQKGVTKKKEQKTREGASKIKAIEDAEYRSYKPVQ